MVRLLVPTTAEPESDVQTKPLSAFTVPCSTKVKKPAALDPAAKSAALAGVDPTT